MAGQLRGAIDKCPFGHSVAKQYFAKYVPARIVVRTTLLQGTQHWSTPIRGEAAHGAEFSIFLTSEGRQDKNIFLNFNNFV